MKYYQLIINCKPDKDIYDSIGKILNVESKSFEPDHLSTEETYDLWIFELQEDENNEIIDFINIFLDLIEPNLLSLEKIGIKTDNILIWKLYEYQHQCTMEFHPQEMKRLGEIGINLNIDCWETKKKEN